MKNHKKILVIDDDPVITQFLATKLPESSYSVITASNGLDGLEKYKVEKPDLIILDIHMPKMDGYTFVLEFKKIGDLRKVPIIMLTSKDSMQSIFVLEGINDYIVKPFNLSELLIKVDRHLKSPVKKILVVDDAASTIELMQYILQARGYEVLVASDGETGLSMAKKENPDLILLDIMMPKLDGFNFCRTLKYDEKYKNVAIVLISGRGQTIDKMLGRQVGANDYMAKPLDPDLLLQKIKELIWDNPSE